MLEDEGGSGLSTSQSVHTGNSTPAQLHAELSSLNIKRGAIKRKVGYIEKFVKEYKPEQVRMVPNRIETLADAYKEFFDCQYRIEYLEAALKKPISEEYASGFDHSYNEILFKLQNLSQVPSENSDRNQSRMDINDDFTLKLPSLGLPSFDGQYANWTAFRDTFSALVDKNSKLQDIQKLHYLKSSLSAEVARTIDDLPLSSQSYKTAWDRLEKRYNNSRLIVEDHVNAILRAPAVGKNAASQFRKLTDTLCVSIGALNALKIATKSWGPIIIPIIVEKFDFHSKREWQSKLTTEIPKLDELIEFMEARSLMLEAVFTQNKRGESASDNHSSFNRKLVNNQKTHATSLTAQQKLSDSCLMCQKNHGLYQCPEFKNGTNASKMEFLRKHKLCFNCLRGSHNLKECKSGHCKFCDERHNSILHDSAKETPNRDLEVKSFTTMANTAHIIASNIILPTARVTITDKNGRDHILNVLLDTGSQVSFITSDCVQKLRLPVFKTEFSVVGINHTVRQINQGAELIVQSNYKKDFKFTVNTLVTNKITDNIPLRDLDKGEFKIPQGIQLADPQFYKSKQIDLLFGADTFWGLLESGKMRLEPNKCILQESKLGWVVGGFGLSEIAPHKQQGALCCTSRTLEEQIVKFWELERFTNNPILSAEERLCKQLVTSSIERLLSGTYSVKLPFRQEEAINFGNSYGMALKRFYALETKLSKDEAYRSEYISVIRDYILGGHVEKVPPNERRKCNSFYLPHHGVIKTDSSTTKLRIVYDATARSTDGESLNDNLLIGPKIQQDLFAILTRFRKHSIAFCADIEKMFFQVEIHPDHRDYQRFLWRENKNQAIEIYRLKKVSFGTASASYLAVRALHQVAADEACNFPLASPIILNDFYMDDVLSGADSVNDAIILKKQLASCLKSGGFNLRKWKSNAPELIEDQLNKQYINLDKDNTSKTLGMMWDCLNDMLSYSFNYEHAPQEFLDATSNKDTKREVLSIISRLYDPLGFINPVLVTAKIILQQLWIAGIGWDETIPENLRKGWQQFVEDIKNINLIKIPRRVINIQSPSSVELHTFCDASMKAFGVAIYIRAINSNEGTVSCRLLCAKSRVAPLKLVTLPRLELCAAVLSVQLVKKVVDSITIDFSSIRYWTDSTIVLSWLKTTPNNLDTFVGNRVSEIQNDSDIANWRHVPSKQNPADIVSRGATAEELRENKLWFHGPEFLNRLDGDEPPIIQVALLTHIAEEPGSDTEIECKQIWPVLYKFSSFTKLIRVVAYCKRFCIKKQFRESGPLSVEELNDAQNIILKQIQIHYFAKEISALMNNRGLPRKSKLLSLNPFLDSEGLIRVGGRLANSTLPYSTKFPVILPKDELTKIIIREEHVKQLHGGPQATLASLRRKFWPLGGRGSIRLEIHKCTKCFHAKPRKHNEIMGNLPHYRVNEQLRPFVNTAIDYAGPVLIKDGKLRTRKMIKSFIALFICLATKAIHLELVTDCTSESFINCLKRFIARRGKPSMLLSDNATTFKGADKDIQNVLKGKRVKEFTDKLATENIKWTFIPPRSPHFGGIYEAGIKSAKFHLKRVVGQALLTYEEMHTVLTMIEACLNSRPITPIPESPNELEALTPGHFLIGQALTSLPQPDFQNTNPNRLSRWQRLEKMRRHYWNRWSREYVTQLQQRTKWIVSAVDQLKVGALVLLQEENLPPLQWALGRIIETHPGKDGKVRVVSVRTNGGTYKRAVQRIAVLPVDVD